MVNHNSCIYSQVFHTFSFTSHLPQHSFFPVFLMISALNIFSASTRMTYCNVLTSFQKSEVFVILLCLYLLFLLFVLLLAIFFSFSLFLLSFQIYDIYIFLLYLMRHDIYLIKKKKRSQKIILCRSVNRNAMFFTNTTVDNMYSGKLLT